MSTPATHQHSYPRHRSTRRSFLAFSAGAVAILGGVVRPAISFARASYDAGQQIPGTQTFSGGTYVAQGDAALYQYAQDEAGTAYYTTNSGSGWEAWQPHEAQVSPVAWDSAPVAYDGKAKAYYTGKDGYLYEQGWDSYNAETWTDVSGDYTYGAAPAATVYQDTIHLFGSGTDGYVYHKAYDGAAWGEWEAVNETPAKAGVKPYAFTWGAKSSVFWLGADGTAYWNRYNHDEGAWKGAKQIPSEYGFKATPYAVSNTEATTVTTYAVNDAGAPVYNSFDGESWAGWQAKEASWTATYQPSAYVQDGKHHVVYTADSGNAYYAAYEEGTWGDWEDLGSNYGYDSQQYAYNDSLYLTYTGQDGGIYYKTYAADGGGEIEPTPTPKVKY